jgi:FkbM family methyltransferase
LRGTIAANLLTGHIDSLELLEIARRWQPSVIYDIGANVGTWTRLARAVLPHTQLHAFEPLPEHIARFRHELHDVPNIVLHPVALGATAGVAAFHVVSFSDASSFLPLSTAGVSEWQFAEQRTESLPLVPLDDHVQSAGIPLPDLLKLDVQGFEVEVLKGATACLAHACAVITEVSFVEYYEGQPLFADLVTFLNERGFVPHAFGVQTAVGRPIGQTDVLFVARKHLPSEASF